MAAPFCVLRCLSESVPPHTSPASLTKPKDNPKTSSLPAQFFDRKSCTTPGAAEPKVQT